MVRRPTNTVAAYGLRKRVEAVKGCRHIGKEDMKLNTATPRIRVNPETYEVFADGHLASVPPATELALTQGACVF